jgi:hypothetical protein
MSERKKVIEIPHFRLTEVRLLSLSYRAATAEPSLYSKPEIEVKGSIRYSFYARRKNSFKVKATQEIKAEGVSFRVRHEVRFASDVAITSGLFDDDAFHDYVVNMIIPFASELFATLTGKTFDGPLLVAGQVTGKGKTEK